MVKVAVIGAGLLGATVADELGAREQGFGYLSHERIEVTDLDNVKRALDGYDVAINTVAFHRLAECEADKPRAIAVNTDGARNVASVLPTVYISTDYVFNDGGPHDEVLPGERPRSVYGQTKLGGELATLERGGIVVRVSGLFGRHASRKGPTFPEQMDASFDAVRLPTDQVFSPTWAPDAAKRIVDLALDLARPRVRCFGGCIHTDDECSRAQGIYHAANAGTTSWAQFGEEILALLRHRRQVIPYVAHDPIRPRNSALRSTRLPALPHWRISLDDWLRHRDEEIFRNRVSPLREGA